MKSKSKNKLLIINILIFVFISFANINAQELDTLEANPLWDFTITPSAILYEPEYPYIRLGFSYYPTKTMSIEPDFGFFMGRKKDVYTNYKFFAFIPQQNIPLIIGVLS